MSILEMTKQEILALSYDDFSKMISELTWEEVMKVSETVGYPVFTRKCMGNLMHKFVLLQDGAAAAIVNENGEILLQSRADRDMWGMPGGCQEVGERFEDVVIREVKEETNLDVLEDDLELIKLVSGMSRLNSYPNGDVVVNNTAFYLVRRYSGELKWDSESKEMKFFSLDDLPTNLHDADLIEEYKKYVKIQKMN